MNRDQIRGASRHLKGRAQTALGGLTGDPARQVRGAVNQVAGGAQYAYGRARGRADDLAEDGRHLAHEAWERADHLIEDGRHYAEEARRLPVDCDEDDRLAVPAEILGAGGKLPRADACLLEEPQVPD